MDKERQRELAQRVYSIFDQVNQEHWDGFEVKAPNQVKFSNRLHLAGRAHFKYSRLTREVLWAGLTFSIPYHNRFGWDGEFDKTIKHEIIHLWQYHVKGKGGHGRDFKYWVWKLGCKLYGERVVEKSEDPRYKYIYECPKCGHRYYYTRPVSVRSCGSGGCGVLRGFDPTKQLRLVSGEPRYKNELRRRQLTGNTNLRPGYIKVFFGNQFCSRKVYNEGNHQVVWYKNQAWTFTSTDECQPGHYHPVEVVKEI